MKSKLIIAGLVAAVCAASAFAAPAPFMWYKSKLDGTLVCSNAYIGSGWEPQPQLGTYKNAACR